MNEYLFSHSKSVYQLNEEDGEDEKAAYDPDTTHFTLANICLASVFHISSVEGIKTECIKKYSTKPTFKGHKLMSVAGLPQYAIIAADLWDCDLIDK